MATKTDAIIEHELIDLSGLLSDLYLRVERGERDLAAPLAIALSFHARQFEHLAHAAS